MKSDLIICNKKTIITMKVQLSYVTAALMQYMYLMMCRAWHTKKTKSVQYLSFIIPTLMTLKAFFLATLL